jgi:hypothetical protein
MSFEYSAAMNARGRLGGVAAILAAALLLGLPAGAAAKPGYLVKNRSLQLTLDAPAASGYRLTLATLGHHQIILQLFDGDRIATYRTTGSVSRDRIKVDFGALGRISVRFEGKRRPFPLIPGLDITLPGLKLPHPDCRGKRPEREVGTFRGTIAFRGERGFTHLRTHRAQGEVRRTYRRVCKRNRPRGPAGRRRDGTLFGGARLNFLVAIDRSGPWPVRFEAIGFDLGPEGEELEALLGTLAFASIYERREGLRIVRAALVAGDDGSLLVDPPKANPVTATVALPRPIPGTAKYSKAVGTPATWVGSLKASLPGVGTVPLTGPGFSATLCRVPLLDLTPRGNRCLRRSGAVLPSGFATGTPISAQISGSQSQLFGDARLSWSR